MRGSTRSSHPGSPKRGGDDGESPPTKEEAGAMVDDALRFLQGGLEALRRS